MTIAEWLIESKAFPRLPKWQAQLLCMVKAIVYMNCQVLQPVSRLEASLGICPKVVGLSAISKDEVDAGYL